MKTRYVPSSGNALLEPAEEAITVNLNPSRWNLTSCDLITILLDSCRSRAESSKAAGTTD